MASLGSHYHGKNSVRLLKVRRDSARHEVIEMTITLKIWSPDYERAYTKGDNTDLIATDTMRNTCYVVAKTHEFSCVEEYVQNLANFLLDKYSFLTRVWAHAVEDKWERAVDPKGRAHNHAFVRSGPENNFAEADAVRGKPLSVTSGVRNLIVLKTTQTGFVGFLRNEHTTLPEVTERLLSTNITATWKYAKPGAVVDPIGVRKAVRATLLDLFFGPAQTGVYSKSVQETLYKCGTAICARVPSLASITMNMPNVHYIPFKHLANLGLSFNDDIFLPTSEPAGTIEATVVAPRSKL